MYTLVQSVSSITPEHDSKLQMLLATIGDKIENLINPGNRKILLLTAFSDTAEYLYEHVSAFAKEKYGLHTALVTVSVDGCSTLGVSTVFVHDHLSPKDTLDAMRQLCRGKNEPIEELYQAFNQETSDGRSMAVYSSLLEDAVLSILDAKEDSDLDSLFRAGGTSALLSQVSGLDDFQLVCFLVIR